MLIFKNQFSIISGKIKLYERYGENTHKKTAKLKYLCLIIFKPVPSGRNKMNDREVK